MLSENKIKVSDLASLSLDLDILEYDERDVLNMITRYGQIFIEKWK